MAQTQFYSTLPRNRDFAALAQSGAFTPLPDDWHLCCSDIVDSTSLIAAGQYKTVNMIGASVIAAMMNALKGEPFPYIFGGDGASFAVPPEHAEQARKVLAGLRSWVEAEFGVILRAAMLPVAWIRAEGLEAAVARYAVSDHADYAMFAGGGLAWAEKQMKAGGFEVLPAVQADPPDLTGLSCRWSNVTARNGTILSLVMLPAENAPPQAFAATAAEVLSLAGRLARNGHPVPQSSLSLKFPLRALLTEARMTHGKMPLFLRKLYLLGGSVLSYLIFFRNRPVGRFDPARYQSVLSANADYRKFEDGLKMTLDCDAGTRDRIMAVLQDAGRAGLIRYGLHEQDEAMITCIVPSAMQDDHIHFVDGAAGGYTQAAAQLSAEGLAMIRPA